MRLGLAASGTLVAAGLRRAGAREPGPTDSLAGSLEEGAGRDLSPATGTERQAVSSSCWQCEARDAVLGFVEDGRLVHLEGNPGSPRTRGRLCARGHAAVGRLTDPDRILSPLERRGRRGSGSWRRISWPEAIGRLASRLRALHDTGEPERFVVHLGRSNRAARRLLERTFLAPLGGGTVLDERSLGDGARRAALALTWGAWEDLPDADRARLVLALGANPYEAGRHQLPLAQRLVEAVHERGVRLVTVDVRLSNTAARSSQWVPVRPGTDLAVVLGLLHVVVTEDLASDTGLRFLEEWTDTDPATLRAFVTDPRSHVPEAHRDVQPEGGYTPAWAEEVSGVPAATIEALAREYAANSPGSTILVGRGVAQRANGVACVRAVLALEALCANLDAEGGRRRAVRPDWRLGVPEPAGEPTALDLLSGLGYAAPAGPPGHRLLQGIREGRVPRAGVYLAWGANPAFEGGDLAGSRAVLADPERVAYLVSWTTHYDETAHLADLILPDVTWLERWDLEDPASFDNVAEYALRQPLVEPLGEARDLRDVLPDLAARLGLPDVEQAVAGRTSAEAVEAACEATVAVRDAGGLPALRAEGVLVDEEAAVPHRSYLQGGFAPHPANDSGRVRLRPPQLAAAGLPALPAWQPIPEHADLGHHDYVLVPFRLAAHAPGTQVDKHLMELEHHVRAWIHPLDAEALDLTEGDVVRLTRRRTLDDAGRPLGTDTSELELEVHLTEAVVRGVLALPEALGHDQSGRYASGIVPPLPEDEEEAGAAATDPDAALAWWSGHGWSPRWLIPSAGDPVAGAWRAKDIVVRVEKVADAADEEAML